MYNYRKLPPPRFFLKTGYGNKHLISWYLANSVIPRGSKERIAKFIKSDNDCVQVMEAAYTAKILIKILWRLPFDDKNDCLNHMLEKVLMINQKNMGHQEDILGNEHIVFLLIVLVKLGFIIQI